MSSTPRLSLTQNCRRIEVENRLTCITDVPLWTMNSSIEGLSPCAVVLIRLLDRSGPRTGGRGSDGAGSCSFSSSQAFITAELAQRDGG